MTAKADKSPETRIPALSTPAQIGAILKLPRTTVRDGLVQQDCNEKGQYDTIEGFRCIIRHLLGRAARSVNTEAKRRREDAEAESSEIKAAKDRNELMLREDCMKVWDDGFVKMRQKIASASYIAPQLRQRLVKDLLEIEVEPPEE